MLRCMHFEEGELAIEIKKEQRKWKNKTKKKTVFKGEKKSVVYKEFCCDLA